MKYLCLVYLEESKLHAVTDRECASCGAGLREVDCRQKLWRQRPEIDEPIGFRPKDDDGNGVRWEILLERQVPIHSDKHIEMFGG